MSKLKVTFLTDDGMSKTATGKPARALQYLIKAGRKGITALEMSNTWALRLSEYIRVLRHDCGLHIVMQREDHDGGWHGRYILLTPVTIIE